ncbi:MAG: alternative ribosome rescue aminoacyl-tRNA hydrolase ArfB [Patescibacteria group bacterium]|jgi:ribosome-associated protein
MPKEFGHNPAVIDGEARFFDETALRAELQFDFARSGGPGGQGVNTSDTKVHLRWNVETSLVFSPEEKTRIKSALAGMINKKGELVMACQVTRSQRQNREMVLDNFLADLEDALRPIVPRIPTRKPRAVRRRQLDEKTRRGKVKKDRSKKVLIED